MAEAPAPVRVIGLGEPLRGDDGAGRAVAARLRGRLPAGVSLHEAAGEATGLLALLAGARAAVLADACRSGAPAGTVQRLDPGEGPLPAAVGSVSTHGLGLAEALEIARALDGLPPVCRVYAIEAGDVSAGAGLGAEVARAVDAVAEAILEEVASLFADGGRPPHA
ncbi:hydrogenase maturation protease [Albimonas sp. CAU 1670]|uniref:hydrogenase maturation protease n=1 Tax=Albimonas sp. CAU 1670 TaxID=3032599 RepID=UPI0023DBB90F|nr:hydrogenase maturation protease [Albimonas sp. CAU 1670]MDF2231830.1 hydrogenase maturation protease [Albimonas sp. CAU 1670]